jgi:hypothetical protein
VIYVLIKYVDYEPSEVLAVYTSIESARHNTGIDWNIPEDMKADIIKTGFGSYVLMQYDPDMPYVDFDS